MVEKNAGWELMSLSNTMWSASHRQIIAMPSCLLSQALTRSVILNRAYSKIEGLASWVTPRTSGIRGEGY